MQEQTEKHGALASATPPPGVAADWTVPQRWEEFTPEDHWVWDTLFARQQALLAGRAVSAFGRSLDVLRLSRPGIPDFDELNDRLHARTGWTVVAVPGLVPDDAFFTHLSERRFPAGNFIRRADQLDYLEEPDAFHDVFGHVPLLAEPEIADFMQALGHLGLQAIDRGALHRVARLYWYTSSSASRARMTICASMARASCRALANRITRWKARARAASPSTCRRSCARSTRRTRFSRTTS
jgi:phenylalanine-4-hydroxylase